MSLRATVIESTSAHFPTALQNETLVAPVPRLWAIGNLDLLKARLLGFFCSTRCPGAAILRTYDLVLALREAGIALIGGFHTPMEKECLEVLLRGIQPVVICPARSIARLRLPAAWRRPLAEQRLLVVSPFKAAHRRPTTALAEQRNRFVAALANDTFVAHAAPGSQTARLCGHLVTQGKRLYTLDLAENAHLVQYGVMATSIDALVNTLSPHA